jgi:ABC-type multidrug transport system ATPase subunit
VRIRIQNLSKTYGRGTVPALSDLNLEIRHGTFGLLGPNGAGKTTLIKILSTQMEPSEGTVEIDGWDLRKDRAEVRRRLGYLPQHFGAYPQLSAWEFLDYMGRLGGLHEKRQRQERVGQVLEDVALYEARERKTGTFSGGMRRRLGIAQAILADPEFIIVDEPTVGLDPEERIRFRGILGRLSANRTILISTHIVGDISSTCEDLAVLREGQLLFHGAPEDFVAKAEGKTWLLQTDDDDFEAIANRFSVVNISADGIGMELRIVGDETPPPGAEAAPPNLEDAYIYFMGADSEALQASV